MRLFLVRNRRQAVVLLVAISVLAVLALLATVFATVSRMERAVSRNYVDLVRAKLLAQAGIEQGVRALRDPSIPPAKMTYYGEDYDASGDLTDVYGVREDVYAPNGVTGTLQTLDCPLSYALRPSLFYDPANTGRPALVTIIDAQQPGGTRQAGYSGILEGTYQALGDTYSVKIVDQNSLVDLNDVMVNSSGGVVEPNTRLARVLNTLGQALGLGGNEGTLITNWRAANAPVNLTTTTISGISGGTIYNYNVDTGVTGGFTSVEQLATILPANSYAVMKEYVSTRAWKDNSTILPMPQSFGAITPQAAYSLENPPPPDKYNCQYLIEPRAPVNVNQAPWAVLAALMSGLTANYVAVIPGNYNGACEAVSYSVQTVSIPSYSGPGSAPGKIASTILWYRTGNQTVNNYKGPFGTWEDWNNFVDDCLAGSNNPFGGPIINDQQGKVLKAAFNPNTRSMRANPDRTARFRRTSGGETGVDIDKTDLSVYSTELCFSPMGTFTLGSIGRVLDGAGNIVAQYEIDCVVKAFDTVRHTTARDFLMYNVPAGSSPGLTPTQYATILPDSVPNQSGGAEPPNPGGTEDKELPATYNVPTQDDRWAYDGAVTQSAKDPVGVAETYLWPSTQTTMGGGMDWETNASASPQPMGWPSARPHQDRSLFGMRTGGGMPGDSIKGDIFADGIYVGSDKYRALTYALPWTTDTMKQLDSNNTGMSLEYWMKPNCEGTTKSSLRRGYQFVRSDLGTQTIQMKVYRGTPPPPSQPVTVTPDGTYAQFTCHWWEQTGAYNQDGSLIQLGSANLDPNSISGFSIVGGASNEKYGVLWDWESTTGPSKMYAGMWHHIYLGTWDNGYYTASNMYVDGIVQNGVLNQYGAPLSGWVTAPFVEYVNPREYLIWLWVQPPLDYGNIVDVGTNVHDLVWSDDQPTMTFMGQSWGDPDRMFDGTLDQFRIRQSQTPPGGSPSRLSPGVAAQYSGFLNRTLNPATGLPTLPGKEMPTGTDVVITSVEWTRYRPEINNSGGIIPDDPTTPDGPASQRPTTRFSYGTVSTGCTTALADETGKPQPLAPPPSTGYLVTSSNQLQYSIQFDNKGLSPLNMSAYFDDVTFHYYTGSSSVQFLSWEAGAPQ